MPKSEIEKRNLISTIHDCLKEHKVELSGEGGTVPFYLIEVGTSHSLFGDFVDTYSGKVDPFQRRLAKNLLGTDQKSQTYGVLVDTDLKYNFAFNRKFADLDRKNKKIKFKDVEDYLLEVSNKGVEGSHPIHPNNDIDGLDTVFRYSIVGEKNKKTRNRGGEVDFEGKSLLDRISTLYSATLGKVKMRNKEKDFINRRISYETSTLADFMQTYCQETDEFKLKLAKKLFGKGKTKNEYGVLFSKDLQMQFAYNTKFAKLDRDTREIVFHPIEDVLIGQTEEEGFKLPPLNFKREKPSFQPDRGRGTVIRYSIQGKD